MDVVSPSEAARDRLVVLSSSLVRYVDGGLAKTFLCGLLLLPLLLAADLFECTELEGDVKLETLVKLADRARFLILRRLSLVSGGRDTVFLALLRLVRDALDDVRCCFCCLNGSLFMERRGDI